MTIVAGIALAVALYGWGLVRVARARRRFPRWAPVAFALGLAAIAAALLGPLDDLSDAFLSWHMLQHLVLVGVAAPLLLLGAPLRLALAALPKQTATALSGALASPAVRIVTHPAFAWFQFAFVLYAAHFSPLYEAALENESVHAFEHVLFLTSGIVFWTPLLAVAPVPHAPPHAVRLLAIFMAIPMSAFLGFTFYVERHVLYPHYALRPGAVADQMNAGAVMWIAGGVPLFVALLCVVADWAARERRSDPLYGGAGA
jgi:cytochrome c oxidase assembly factor CtaG